MTKHQDGYPNEFLLIDRCPDFLAKIVESRPTKEMAFFSKDANEANEHPNLVACDDCGQPISRNAEVCPHCGRRIRGSRTDQLATIIFVLMLLSLVVAFMNMASR